jgi:hypothetical protein
MILRAQASMKTGPGVLGLEDHVAHPAEARYEALELPTDLGRVPTRATMSGTGSVIDRGSSSS